MERIYIADALSKIDEKIKLVGWVNTKRDHGKITFVDLRDSSGIIQCVGVNKMADLHVEAVVELFGLVKNRPQNMVKPELPLGAIEFEVEGYTIINDCTELPIPVDTDGKEINEEARLKYRYLDLRRARMHTIIELRSNFIKALRDSLHSYKFTEVETPILTKSTKEGARDFIVPSRFYPGEFYSLPQSPQQYKQLLMTAGVDKYFQFAKCVRDEDLRADRGFEFTQLDLEMSFVEETEDVMSVVESIVKNAVLAVGGKLQNAEFPRISYQEALAKYGQDKFDMRSAEEQADKVLAFAWVINFPFFKQVDKADAAEVQDGKSGWTFTHNPFSMPKKDHIEDHLAGKNISNIQTLQYDLVCNGYEVGGGSIRSHRADILKATFGIMGYSDAEIEDSIGHMLKAFSLGTPPHGGIALGLDRLVMLLANETSLKETIAFPMTSSGKTAIMDAPSTVDAELLKELSLRIEAKK